VGNQKYEGAGVNQLYNAGHDADTVAEELRTKASFELSGGEALWDLTSEQLSKRIDNFCEEVQALEDCLALVFFAGHGSAVMHKKTLVFEQHILGTNFACEDESEFRRHTALGHGACSVERHLIAHLCHAKPKAAVVLIDACRTVDLHWAMGSIPDFDPCPDRGLLLAYGCAPHKTAGDGKDMGVFTRRLVTVRTLAVVDSCLIFFTRAAP